MSLNQGKRHHTPISVSWYIVRSKNKVWGEVQGLWRVPCQLEKHGTRLGQGSCWNGQKGTISYPMVFESSPSGHFYSTKSTCNMNVFVARPGCSPQNKLAVHCCHHFFPPPLSLHDRKDDVLSSYQAARPVREQFFNYVLDSRPAAVKVATCADRNGKK